MVEYINQFYDMYNNSLFLNENKYKELFIINSPNYGKYKDHIDYIIVMENIVNNILDKYDKIPDKNDNLSLNIQICLLLNRYLVVIFTTMCILNDVYNDKLTTVSFKKRRTGKSSSLTISKPSNTKINYIIYIKNIIENFNKDIFGEEGDTLNIDKFRNPDIKKLYNYIGNKEDIENIEPLDIKEIEKYNFKYICEYIKNYLIYINYTIFIDNDNKFITIPQYHDICWFNSIITGITYSDRSKKLLLDNRTSRINDDYQEFNKFIFYIIDNITNTYKEYSENINDDCKILKYLKQQPVYIVKYLVWKYCKNNSLDIFNNIFNNIFNIKKLTTNNIIGDVKTKYLESNEIKKNFKLLLNHECKNNFFLKIIIKHKNSKTITETITEIIDDFIDIIYKNNDDDYFVVDDNDIFIDKFNNYLITNHILYNENESIIQYITDKEINTGLHYADNAISFFYKILNINTLICNANISTGNLKLTCSSKVQDPNPDVIIMNVDMNDPSTPGTEIKAKSSKLQQITYKEKIYILDYIINITCDKQTCDNCCHCISAIHYNNNEYFHNSAINTIEDHRCLFEEEEEEIDVNIPCSLIKQNWSDKVYKDIYYNIYKCKYSEKNPKIELHKENKYIFEITTYNYRSRNVYVYIKKDTPSTSMALSTLSSAPMTLVSPSAPSVPMTTGGSKKINFTYNNKTYKRTLYTSNNKYYIIFNKKKIYINKKNLATF
jgi:hypothetical protein